MKTAVTFLFCLVCMQLLACNKNEKVVGSSNPTADTSIVKMKITISKHTFSATLDHNATAAAFRARLPLTMEMTDLNDNEKYFDLPVDLPANASNPGTIKTGDLMLYGSNTLVLFYKSFSTSYSYTRLAHVDDPSGLAAALGPGKSTVKFELE